jgi:transposase
VKVAPTPSPKHKARHKARKRGSPRPEPTPCPDVVIGVDLGDKQSFVCVLDPRTKKHALRPLHTGKEAFRDFFRHYKGARVVLEAGTHSRWASAILTEELQLEVIVANPRKLKLISQSGKKTDRVDAELLARVGAFDPDLLAPIQHRGQQACAHMTLLQGRDQLVRERTRLVNFVRGQTKSHGARIQKVDARCFHVKAGEQLPAELRPYLQPILEVLAGIDAQIRHYDAEIKRVSKESYPEETACLQQVSGVGEITSLAFVLAIEDPERFAKPRQIGAYLGLVPRQCESGDRSPELRVTKAGNGFLRRLLVQAAHYVIGHFGPDTDLRRWGLRIAERGGVPNKKQRGKKHGGKNAKKRAVVAVARKLAVLLLTLWKTKRTYVPLREPGGATEEAA